MDELFEIATGTVTGRDHVHAFRNNQDACVVERSPDAIVAVVCDGCSSGRFSEVGALLGARLFASRLMHTAHAMTVSAWAEYYAEEARKGVLAQLSSLAATMGASRSSTVNDYFLFTVVVAVINRRFTAVMGIGDGVWALNGDLRVAGPFPNNAPPYPAYELTGSSVSDDHPELLRFALHAFMPTSDVRSLLIGTDGVNDLAGLAGRALPGREEPVGPVSQFWENDRFYKNPFILSRRLNLINPSQPHIRVREGAIERSEGLLPDDTTLAVVRRKNGA